MEAKTQRTKGRAKAEHTPGPWHVELCNQGASCWCRIVTTKPGSDEMADCIIPSGSVSAKNAVLIARAPSMFALLQKLLDRLDVVLINGCSFNEAKSIIAEIEAEVAKATTAGE